MLDRAVFRFSIGALVITLGAPSVRGLALPNAAEPSPSRASLNGLDGINFFNAAMLAGFGPYVVLAEQKWTQENIGFVLTASGLAGLLAHARRRTAGYGPFEAGSGSAWRQHGC